jgi:hypothetical protein
MNVITMQMQTFPQPAARFLVRGLDNDGREAFYTGRAGDGWLGAKAEAFGYQTLDGARNRATGLNRHSELHGWRFIAVPAEAAPSKMYLTPAEAEAAGLPSADEQIARWNRLQEQIRAEGK